MIVRLENKGAMCYDVEIGKFLWVYAETTLATRIVGGRGVSSLHHEEKRFLKVMKSYCESGLSRSGVDQTSPSLPSLSLSLTLLTVKPVCSPQ